MARSDKGIEVIGLVRRFKDVEAVAGIDLTISPGEIYGFLGPNGAGKSTTVHMLTTLLPPTAGSARVAGHDVVREGPLLGRALAPVPPARGHFRLKPALQGLPRSERAQRGDELLERVGLSDAADRRVR